MSRRPKTRSVAAIAGAPAPAAGTQVDNNQAYMDSYLRLCDRYSVAPSADILVWLRLKSDCLMPCPERGTVTNGDRILLPLYDLLLEYRDLFEHLKALDLSKCKLGYSGAVLVSHILQEDECSLRCLNMENCPIGPEGAAALAPGLIRCGTLEQLNLKACSIGEAGGYEMAKYLDEELGADESTGLVHVMDLTNNSIGFHACNELEKSAAAYRKAHHMSHEEFLILLDGNKGIDEILNAVSHGLGTILSIIGTVFLSMKISPHPDWLAHVACTLYSASLIILYLSSTLYHSFHTFGYTRMVFGTLDHCAIYVLIAGSYTPFLAILLPNNAFYTGMLAFLWGVALFGFVFSAGYEGAYKVPVELTLYLGMGWAACLCLEDMTHGMGEQGVALLLAGGVAYTVGVPFFVKDGRTLGMPDHTIWHIFVLLGSLLHFICIYNFVVPDLSPGEQLCVAVQADTAPLGNATPLSIPAN
mmetsp:Transcript_13874/g.41232  ORF Transcript_13874/g.41232 Transcript_13874/m.41232 type:complete len:472 (-) Transcript_13874:187-1602(-)